MLYKKVLGDYSESNTYILFKEGFDNVCLIDAGASVEKIRDFLPANKNISAIILTHGHFDHISNLDNILNEFGKDIKIYLHPQCKEKLFDAKKNLSYLYGLNFSLKKVEKEYNFVLINQGDKVNVFDNEFYVYNFKGHSGCGLCFKNSKLFFVGDVVFESGVGRYDFEENGLEDTIESLEKFLKIEDYKLVLSGHGNESSFERQQRNINSFLRFLKTRN